jgi:hypothetical protein
MSTVMAPFEEGGVETVKISGREDEAPATITTTLYDLIAALQEVVHPGEEALVVATVVSLLRAGQIRRVARGLGQDNAYERAACCALAAPVQHQHVKLQENHDACVANRAQR